MPWTNGRWVPEDDSSVTKLNAMTATDSPYMQLARNTAAETANSRGLINSSIAAGAGSAAAIAAAAPFALNDSQLTGQKNLSFEQAYQSSDLSKQQSQQALDAQKEAEAAQSKLSAQEYGQQTGLLGIQGTQAQELAKTNNAADMNKTQATLASTERTNATNQFLNADANYLQAFGQIASNPDIPAATRDAYLQNILSIRSAGQDMVQKMYGITLDWGNGSTGGGTAATLPPVATTSSTPPPTAPGKKDDILKTLISPISTKTGRKILTGGLASFF